MTDVKNTNFTTWNGETYSRLGDLFDTISHLANFDESLDLDLEHDEILRLAIWCWNNHEKPTADDIEALIEAENEAFAGENSSVADFTEEWCTEVDDLSGVPSYVVIDWLATWDSALRFDFFNYEVVDIDGVYRRFFWKAY